MQTELETLLANRFDVEHFLEKQNDIFIKRGVSSFVQNQKWYSNVFRRQKLKCTHRPNPDHYVRVPKSITRW